MPYFFKCGERLWVLQIRKGGTTARRTFSTNVYRLQMGMKSLIGTRAFIDKKGGLCGNSLIAETYKCIQKTSH